MQEWPSARMWDNSCQKESKRQVKSPTFRVTSTFSKSKHKKSPTQNPCKASAWWVSQRWASESARANGTCKVGHATRHRLTMPHSAISRLAPPPFGGTKKRGGKQWTGQSRRLAFSKNTNKTEISISLPPRKGQNIDRPVCTWSLSAFVSKWVVETLRSSNLLAGQEDLTEVSGPTSAKSGERG